MQYGGNPTPLPLRYFQEEPSQCHLTRSPKVLGTHCAQSGGNPTPWPMSYFNPTMAAPAPTKCQRPQAQQCCCLGPKNAFMRNVVYQSGGSSRHRRSAVRRGNQSQKGGGTFGAPFGIPNFGLNPNFSPDQMRAESQRRTGFEYRFNSPKECSQFCSLWGNNLPSFNKV